MTPKMMVIAGDGIAAGVLHRALDTLPHKVIIGKSHQNHCTIRPCGWGIAAPGLDIIRSLGIEPPILRYDNRVLLDGREMKAELWSIDKPALIYQLLKGATLAAGIEDGDLVIDATGLARAYIGPARDDCFAHNYQMRVRGDALKMPSFDLIQGGYRWLIPLSNGEVHIGLGSVSLTPVQLRMMFKEMQEGISGEVICACQEPVRVSGLAYPLLNDNVVAVGEAAGTVVPLGGAGIVSSMQSALLLAETLWHRYTYEDYAKRLRQRFGHLDRQKRSLDRMLNRGNMYFADYFTLWSTLRAIGLKPKLSDMRHILKCIKKSLTK